VRGQYASGEPHLARLGTRRGRKRVCGEWAGSLSQAERGWEGPKVLMARLRVYREYSIKLVRVLCICVCVCVCVCARARACIEPHSLICFRSITHCFSQSVYLSLTHTNTLRACVRACVRACACVRARERAMSTLQPALPPADPRAYLSLSFSHLQTQSSSRGTENRNQTESSDRKLKTRDRLTEISDRKTQSD
jgi:hypothetical protein